MTITRNAENRMSAINDLTLGVGFSLRQISIELQNISQINNI